MKFTATILLILHVLAVLAMPTLIVLCLLKYLGVI